MNFLDYSLLVIVVIFAILGYRKGIIVSLVTIAALILGIYAAVNFSNYLDATLMENLKTSRKWLPFVSFGLTFLLVLVAVLLIGKLMEKLVDVVGLGFINRLLGTLLGVLKGIILASVLFFLAVTIDHTGKWLTPQMKKESLFYTRISEAFPRVVKWLGSEIRFTGFIPLEKK
jgi:membrane protein required for colicin V production